ncbi:MAG: DinB family protein [Acidobacteria bacterium]|nr:DinB family protein [Acidobacteriota bacterium]
MGKSQSIKTRWIWRPKANRYHLRRQSNHGPSSWSFSIAVERARAAIAAASDDELFKPWTLQNNGKQILTLPKIAVLRGFVMNHNIHHRAQLGVYLRLNDIPVPAIYGPSADESAF